MKSVYVEGDDTLLTKMFREDGWFIVDSIFSADLLCLEGGADVTPILYAEENTHSYSNEEKDIHSLGLIGVAVLRDIPIVGVCRGSQILNVYHGGTMVQHIEDHAGPDHTVYYHGRDWVVSSSHHQESVPYDNYETYVADDGTCEAFFVDKGPETKTHLGVQFHPEYFPKGHECRKLFYLMLSEIM